MNIRLPPPTLFVFMLIVLASAALRYTGLGYDLPHAYNPDDLYTMDQAVSVAGGAFPAITRRGFLAPLMIGATMRVASTFSSLKNVRGTFQEAYVADKTPFFLIGRGIIASFSVATIIVLFFLALSLVGEGGALLSTAVLAVNLLEIQYAHEIYADTVLMFATTLMLYFLVRAHARWHPVLLGFAFISLGIAMAVQITALLFLPLFFLLSIRVLRESSLPHRKKINLLLIIMVITVAAVILLAPALVARLHEFQTGKWLAPADPYVDPLGLPAATTYKEHVVSYLLWLRDSVNTLPFVMVVVGVFVAITKRNRFAPVLCGFTLWYFLVIATALPDWNILLLPILPIMSLFAGLGCIALYRFLVRAVRVKAVGMILVASLFVPATIKAFWFAHSYTVPDTRTLEAKWFTDHSVDESRVARDGFTSITLPPPNRLTSKLTRSELQSLDYVVLSSWYSRHFSEPWRNTPKLARFYTDIEDSYTR
ncbi:glycosyltransferase family 39 protein [Candidatus Gottesmanbacteria bacterium]|nr:glycosyltransferase family 39 protein [Candidatus Gottesmanbacteria bacterium]